MLLPNQKQAVFSATLRAAEMDAKDFSQKEKGELAYQMANIAELQNARNVEGNYWNSLQSDVVAQVRNSPQYLNIITRMRKDGSIYGKVDKSGGGGSWGFMDQLISGVPNYLLYGGVATLGFLVLRKPGKKKGRK